MKWIEIIELRSVSSKGLKAHLRKLTAEVNREARKQTASVYFRVPETSGFSLHIVHTTNNIDNAGSDLGLRIAEGMKEFGPVNHSVWIKL